MTFGQEAIAAFCEKQAAFLAKVNPTPMDYTIHAADPVGGRARRRASRRDVRGPQGR